MTVHHAAGDKPLKRFIAFRMAVNTGLETRC